MFTKGFMKWSNRVTKETIYYKIQLGLKFKFLCGPVKLKTGLKPFPTAEHWFARTGINIPNLTSTNLLRLLVCCNLIRAF